jgi:hypothetical protein
MDAEQQEQNSKAMKKYVRARMNFLMKEAQEQYGNDSEYGDATVVFKRQPHWSTNEFRIILVALITRTKEKLNDYKTNEFSFFWQSPKKDDETTMWKVSVSWSIDTCNPFDDLYDEDEETIENEAE